MTTIPNSTIEAATIAISSVKILHGRVGERLSMSEMRAVAETAILAALPHLGKPVCYLSPFDLGELSVPASPNRNVLAWRQPTTNKGVELVPLYLAPPTPAPAALPEGRKAGDLARASSALLNTLWQLVWSGSRSHDENWAEMDKRFPSARWVEEELKSCSAPPAPAAAPARIVRHKKRGSTYEVVGVGRVQSEHWRNCWGGLMGPKVDMAQVAIYRSLDDGSIWVRPVAEFEDGRFEDIQQMEPATAPGHTDLMVDPETIDAITEANPPPAEPPKISLSDAAWNLLYARERDEQAVGYRADLWDCLRAILDGEEGAGPSPADAAYETEARHG